MSPASWRRSLNVTSDLLFGDVDSILVRVMLAAVTNKSSMFGALTQWKFMYWLHTGPILVFLVSGSHD